MIRRPGALRRLAGVVPARTTTVTPSTASREHWNDGRPAHALDLVEFVAVTPEAHVALWHVLLNIDLVGTITTRQLPIDDPLPYLLTNPRACAPPGINDGVWVNVRDVAICFGARTYGTDRPAGRRGGRRALRDRRHARRRDVTRVRTRPDLVAEHDAIGALLLGGVSPTRLAGGRRLTAATRRCCAGPSTFFRWPVAPMSQTLY